MPQGEQSLSSYLGVAEVGVGNNYKGGGHFEGASLGFSHQFLHQIIRKSGIFYTSKEKRNKTVFRSIKDLSCLQLVSLQIYRVNRPFALRGHVTSFLWKWKLYDFAFEKRLVGHILNKIIVIWFLNPNHFLKINEFVNGHVTKMWFLKLWITSLWTQILHLNLKENVEKMMW